MQVIPAKMPGNGERGKRPALSEWRGLTDRPMDDAEFDRLYGPEGAYRDHQNMGFVTGNASSGLFVLDLDYHKSPEALEWYRSICRDHAGGEELRTPTQITGGGGRQLIFRAPPGWRPPTISTPQGVDIRGQGGFGMLPPSLHESGSSYRWAEGLAPWEVPFLDAPDWLITALDELRQDTVAPSSTIDPPSTGLVDDGREALMATMVWGHLVAEYRFDPSPPTPSRVNWICDTGFPKYLDAVSSRLDEPGMTKADLLEIEGRGRTAYGEKVRAAVRHWDTKVREAAERPHPDDPVPVFEPPSGEGRAERSAIVARPYQWIDAPKLPVRPWIYGNLFLRGTLSVVSGPGGVGKTAWMATTALALASGKPILGEKIWGGPKKVWLLNLEDPSDELSRSIQAAAKRHGIRPDEIAGNLFVNAGIMGGDLKIATIIGNRAGVSERVVDALIEQLRSRQIDLLILDPFVSIHSVNENDNTSIDLVAKTLARVAAEANCAIVVVHHSRKSGGGDGDVDSARGASALINAARLALNLNRMSDVEAGKLGIDADGQSRYVRVNNAKSNRSPLAKASWLKIESVDLGNGEDEYDDGDHVGVVVRWAPPELDNSISEEHIAEIRRRTAGGQCREEPAVQKNGSARSSPR